MLGNKTDTKGQNVAKGTVKFFNNDKGFGFISPETGGTDVFVHISAVRGDVIKEGDTVNYEIGQDRKTGKDRAENVSVI